MAKILTFEEHAQRIVEEVFDDYLSSGKERYSELSWYLLPLQRYILRRDYINNEELARLYHSTNGKEKRNAQKLLLYCNMLLIVSRSFQFLGKGLPMVDLLQEGAIGFLHGLDKFKPELGYNVTTYITWWIAQAMSRAIHDQGDSKAFRLPVHIEERLSFVLKSLKQILMTTGRWPTDQELWQKVLQHDAQQAQEMKLREVVSCRRMIIQGKVAMDQVVGTVPSGRGKDRHVTTLADIIPDEHVTANIETQVDARKMLKEYQDALARIEQVIDSFPVRAAMVLRMRLGLGDFFHPMTLEEVGQRYELTRERIRQIEVRSYGELFDVLGVEREQVERLVETIDTLSRIAIP